MSNNKLIVTGTAGFIGSHLVIALLQRKFVVGVDNLVVFGVVEIKKDLAY